MKRGKQMKKQLIIGLISGGILGVVCIVGASLRSPDVLPTTYLFAFWYNRVIIGLTIGLMPLSTLKKDLLKGIIFGAIVSFAFYSSTNFMDLTGFLAGVVYGAIIPFVIHFILKRKTTIE